MVYMGWRRCPENPDHGANYTKRGELIILSCSKCNLWLEGINKWGGG